MAISAFTRLSIESSADLLPRRVDLWWRSLWEVAVDPAVEFAWPVRLALPNRAVLTHRLAAEGFILGDDEDLPESCHLLAQNRKTANQPYWNSVIEGNDVLAQYYRERYYANNHAWDGLACEFH